jgi:hypothetical protein
MKKANGLRVRTGLPPEKIGAKLDFACTIPYRWDEITLWDEKVDGPKGKVCPVEPFFMKWPEAYPYEDWCVEFIRRKFITLHGRRNYELDLWMPKTVGVMIWIMNMEMISLNELSDFLGMPRTYLGNLSRRDKGFRQWVKWYRSENLDWKIDNARQSKLYGKPSILAMLNRKTHYNGRGASSPWSEFTDKIDVGWQPKQYSRKR